MAKIFTLTQDHDKFTDETGREVVDKRTAKSIIGCTQLTYIGMCIANGHIEYAGHAPSINNPGVMKVWVYKDSVEAYADKYTPNDRETHSYRFRINTTTFDAAINQLIAMYGEGGAYADGLNADAMRELLTTLQNATDLTLRNRRYQEGG